ncbi:PREDICTED: putative F-box/LRR-repeat protein 23 [Camelina sativa]|uniref:F-box/LRR-repeat protein 23 n=1 Tax=Camelina sativa TaxID=90675 RepID=A0ABM0W982_CAMSA|nr:PREDICTED: putative F-box/LRR-repeat protein 23 [Camelina sativa]
MKDSEYRSWADLPSDLTSSILIRLGVIDILENAQKVCRSWRRVCKDPSMWRKIDMGNLIPKIIYCKCDDLGIMCRHAVDRSQGGLVEIDIKYFCTDKLLNYIAHSSSNLRSLRLVECYTIKNDGFVDAVVKHPLLEYLEVTHLPLTGESLKIAGQSCPNLKTLKLNGSTWKRILINGFDNNALAIAESMPKLRHLELLGNSLTNTGLNAILDSCPHLEHLDIGMCFNIQFDEDLKKRCSTRIRVVKGPAI